MRRRAGRLAKIPVARAEISTNGGPTRGLAPEDRSPKLAKIYGGRKQTSNDENLFLFLNIDRLI